MEKNRVLSIASLVLKIFLVIYILFFATFICLAIYWHFNPEAFKRIEISSGFNAVFGIPEIRMLHTEKNADDIILSEISSPMLYWLVIRNSIFFLLGLMIIFKISKIINSVLSLNTFYNDNIHHFRKMGRLFLIMALFIFFNFYYQDKVLILRFSIPFTSLMLAMSCFVLAEIFSEGKLLSEDKKLIV